jgi:hypothetical protein
MKLVRSHAHQSIEEVWEHFTDTLRIDLGTLEEDQYLIVSLKDPRYFVQVMDQGSYGIRAEAVSGVYIKEMTLQMRRELMTGLRRLGWKAPTHAPHEEFDEDGLHKAEGSPNFYLDAAKPISYRELSELMVSTLRRVYRAAHPDDLRYLAASTSGVAIQFPNLGILREG